MSQFPQPQPPSAAPAPMPMHMQMNMQPLQQQMTTVYNAMTQHGQAPLTRM